MTDYKHRPEDVVAGAAIGVAAALACRPSGIGAWWLWQVDHSGGDGDGSTISGDRSGGGGVRGGVRGGEEMALIGTAGGGDV